MSGLYSCRVKVIRAGQELAGSTPSTVQRSLSFHGQGTAILYCSRTFLIAQFPARPVAMALNRLDASLLIDQFGRRPRGNPEAVRESLTRIWISTLYGVQALP